MRDSLAISLLVYNEVEAIEHVIKEFYDFSLKFFKTNSTIYVFEDGSTDGTSELLKELQNKFNIVLFQKNNRQGYMKAARNALLLPKEDFILLCDSDGTHDPLDINKLWSARNKYGIIAGVRENRKDSIFRLFYSKGFNLLMKLLFKVDVKDANAGFKLIRRDIAQEIVPSIKYLKHGFSSELLARAQAKGYLIHPVHISHREPFLYILKC